MSQGSRWTTIVAPTDLSDPSWEAVQVARELAGPDGRVVALYVLPVPDVVPMSPGMAVLAYSPEDEASRVRTTERLLGEQLAERGLTGVEAKVRIGSFAAEIADHTKDIGADLVVISSHGRTGVRRFFLGSVAERVARLAPTPVLILKQEHK